jgi:hypothetical protein
MASHTSPKTSALLSSNLAKYALRSSAQPSVGGLFPFRHCGCTTTKIVTLKTRSLSNGTKTS